MKLTRPYIFARTGAILAAMTVSSHAQLTWAPVDPALDTNIWDLTSLSWSDTTSTLVTWDNTGNQQAIFTPIAAVTTANIADGGVTVGDLLVNAPVAGDILSLQSVTDNLGLITIQPGGATWNTSGAQIEFVNNQTNDTPLSISTGDTLTVTGGGQLDTGERPNGADWVAAGATLDITEATVVRGNPGSVGQFDTVNLAGGSTYFHERNADQTYANNWDLGTGTVTFDNRFSRNYTLNGDISGDGGMLVQFMGNRGITLNGTNTFTGGLEVSNASRVSATQSGIGSGDLILSGTTDTNGGILRLFGVALGERTLTLNGTGGSIVNAGINSLDGDIVGDGNLQIGNAAFNTNTNVITLSGSGDYTGTTTIFTGTIILGSDEAIGSGALTIGGSGTSRLIMNGNTQTLTGLTTAGNNTRQIVNLNATTTGSTAGTIILDIADDEDAEVLQEFAFNSALGVNATDDRGNLNLVKNGAGTIRLGAVAIAGTVEVNAGELRLGNSNGGTVIGDVTNNASFLIDERTTANSFTAGASSDTTFNWEVSDWTGAAGTGFTQLTVAGDVILDATSTLNIVVEEVALANFTESNTSFVVATIGGAATVDLAQITVDASGFTSGTGTWAVSLDGNNVVLDYTSGAASGPYAAFAANFPSLIGGFDDDDDNDGLANGLEYYFFNSDPTVANSLPSPLAVESAAGAGNIVFSHDRPVDGSDILETYEWSTTLDGDFTASGVDNGGTIVTITPGAPVAAAAGYETVTVTTSSTPPLEKVFIRLSVSLQ